MKNKKLSLILVAVLLMSLFTACASKPKTLEQYLQKDTKSMEQIQEIAQQSDMEVEISENTITFTYDLTAIDGLTKDVAQSDEFKTTLDTELSKQASTFEGLCKQIGDAAKVENTQMTVKYTYEGEAIVEQTFEGK